MSPVFVRHSFAPAWRARSPKRPITSSPPTMMIGVSVDEVTSEPAGPIPDLFCLADPNQSKRGHSEYRSSRSVRRWHLLHNKPGDSQAAQEHLLVDGTNPRPAQRRATDIPISRGRLVVHL